mgnify:CR=1 FL=1
MTLKRDPTKALQFGFLALLVISTAQVAWWIADQTSLASSNRNRIEALYEADALAVTAVLAESTEELPALMPHLEIDPIERTAIVREEAIQALGEATESRINRYTWEGGFFLLVLLGGIGILTRTIRHDAELRQRQQNFLAAVSHEFKSPLASMRLSSETLLMRAHDPDTQRIGQRMLDDGERLLRMVDNLLDTTQLEEGRLELKKEDISLRAVSEASATELRERALLSGVEIQVTVADEVHVHADQTTIETVLRNLIDNAIKACAAGGGGNVWVSGERVGEFVEFTVKDDGLGFPPEDAAMIFEKFYRLGDELRRSTPGTGLGLYIVRRLVELSSARIVAESDGPGKGATIKITWPAAESA